MVSGFFRCIFDFYVKLSDTWINFEVYNSKCILCRYFKGCTHKMSLSRKQILLQGVQWFRTKIPSFLWQTRTTWQTKDLAEKVKDLDKIPRRLCCDTRQRGLGADPLENCHLTVKKSPKTWHFFKKKLQKFFFFF